MRQASTYEFEDLIKKLESLCINLETDNLSIEAALDAFEEGIMLLRLAQKGLAEADQKVMTLLELEKSADDGSNFQASD